jgi:hypothetical protein
VVVNGRAIVMMIRKMAVLEVLLCEAGRFVLQLQVAMVWILCHLKLQLLPP